MIVSNMKKQTDRILYLDALRGMTMLLVVYSHIAVLLLHDVPAAKESLLNNIFILFRMPLFFFISGYFLFRREFSLDLLKRRSINRLLKQFYPTVIIWGLYCCLFENCNYYESLLDVGKSGYWFTLVAVELFFFVSPLLYLFHSWNFTNKQITICLVGLAILSVVLHIILYHYCVVSLPNVLNIFSLSQLLKYAPYFILGMIIKIHSHRIFSLLVNWKVMVFTLLLYGVTGWLSVGSFGGGVLFIIFISIAC